MSQLKTKPKQTIKSQFTQEQIHRIKITSVFERLEQTRKQIVVCYGGAASSKSHSMAQLMIMKLLNEQDKIIGIGRKTFPSLRITAYKLITDLLKQYDIYSRVEHNKAENRIDYGTNRIQFFSLDDPEKIKSFVANFIWLEEATDFTFEDFTILKLRLSRASDSPNQIYLTFNPVDSWIFDKLENAPDADWIHSTYKENPFLAKNYIGLIEGLKDQDKNYYNIYALGQRGELEHVIYPRWQLIDEMPLEFDWERYGLDYGYENPTALVHCGKTGDDLYLDELLYSTHMTNAELIDYLKTLPRQDIYADSAEPQRIEEMRKAGLNCYPAVKDVQYGIDMVKRYNIHLTKSSANLIKEIKAYQRKTGKDGRVLEEVVKFRDHLMDAVRYGVLGAISRVEQIIEYYDPVEISPI